PLPRARGGVVGLLPAVDVGGSAHREPCGRCRDGAWWCAGEDVPQPWDLIVSRTPSNRNDPARDAGALTRSSTPLPSLFEQAIQQAVSDLHTTPTARTAVICSRCRPPGDPSPLQTGTSSSPATSLPATTRACSRRRPSISRPRRSSRLALGYPLLPSTYDDLDDAVARDIAHRAIVPLVTAPAR